MTKQAFYELALRKSFENALEEDEEFFTEVQKLGSVDEMSIDEILMKWNLLGHDIPKKQDFKKWGIMYIIQLLGFANRLKDSSFTVELFRFIQENASIYKTNKKEWSKFGDFCYSIFIDNVMQDREFCCNLGTLILREFENKRWFGKFMSLCRAFSMITFDATEEFFRKKAVVSEKELARKKGRSHE